MGYVPDSATPKAGVKTSQLISKLTEIDLARSVDLAGAPDTPPPGVERVTPLGSGGVHHEITLGHVAVIERNPHVPG